MALGSGAPIFDSVFFGSMPERWLGGCCQLKSAEIKICTCLEDIDVVEPQI